MVSTIHRPYEAPLSEERTIAAAVVFAASTGEQFGALQDYDSGWSEED